VREYWLYSIARARASNPATPANVNDPEAAAAVPATGAVSRQRENAVRKKRLSQHGWASHAREVNRFIAECVQEYGQEPDYLTLYGHMREWWRSSERQTHPDPKTIARKLREAGYGIEPETGANEVSER